MIDIKELRRGLDISDEELAAICQNSRISRTRLAMAERGLVALKPDEESTLRLAISYALHCRKTKLLGELGQGHFDDAPITWDEYRKQHESGTMPKRIELMTVTVDLQEIDGQSYFPLSEPIPWHISLTDPGARVLSSQPEVLASMIEGIRTAVEYYREHEQGSAGR